MYYTIQNNNLLMADNEQALSRYYDDVKILPSDYNAQKYNIIDNELVLNHDYENELLEETRANKLDEALAKAYDFEQNGSVEYKNCVFEMSLSNRHNLDNTQEALEKSGKTETPWNDKNDELVTLTLEDVQYIRLNLILGRIKKLWITDYPKYKNQILSAETVEELEQIEINYNRQ